MRAVPSAAAVLCVALALPAAAQSFDGLARFGTPSNPLPVDPFIEIDSLGGRVIRLSWGAFNPQGFTNYGISLISSDITAVDPGVSFSATPGNRSPWTVIPTGNGSAGATGIQDVQSSRGFGASALSITVPTGSPPPPAPVNPLGLGQFTPVYDFTVTVTDLTPRDIPLSVLGTMRVVSDWSVVLTPGSPLDTYTFTPSYLEDPTATGSIILRIVPGPGAAGLAMLGGVAAARRRRDYEARAQRGRTITAWTGGMPTSGGCGGWRGC